jgi:DNA gyrase/topoisomerase IV subunit B
MNNQEIKYLEDHEHLLLRPTVYIGSVDPSEERLPIVKDNKLIVEPRVISVGMVKIFNEALDNAFDVYKKNPLLKNRKVVVSLCDKTNRVDIIDHASGFYKGTEVNKKTGKTNIETAVSMLRAGSNFGTETDASVIGTNGIGISATNILSDWFEIETKNSDFYYRKHWDKFVGGLADISKKKGRTWVTGTRISFIPRTDIFKGYKWDFDVMKSIMVLKKMVIEQDELTMDIDLEFNWNGLPVELPDKKSFIPQGSWIANTNMGTLVVMESYEGSGSISFVNSAMCQGIHQKIVNDQINARLDDNLGHHFYETILVFNFPPKLVRFGDQNKTRFVSTRDEVESIILNAFRGKLEKLYQGELFKNIQKRVESRKAEGEMKKLRAAKKQRKNNFSPKYFPPSGRGENLFVVEGESAKGSILQKRNPKTDGVYALKGKIMNTKSVSDLSTNKEVVDLMHILDLDLDPKRSGDSPFRRVIVATDADFDGNHIFCLITNLFYKWFPHVINEGRLFHLNIPLISADEKQRLYFYDIAEFDAYTLKKKNPKNVRYLKGLGSLDVQDWEYVMNNKKLEQVQMGTEADRYMDMSFGNSADLRKKWLRGEF